MKKDYIRPEADILSFQPEEALMTGEAQTGPGGDLGVEILPSNATPWSLRP